MDLTQQEHTTLNFLEMLLRKGDNVIAASDKLKNAGIDPQQVDRVVEIRSEIAAQRQRFAMGHAVVDPEDAPQAWYVGPLGEDIFWPSLKSAMEGDPKWVSVVPSLDASSTDVVSLLADPHRPVIRTRGLVLGHVQSGKTANFTATIAKAADAGYRLFVVLSGVHNALRKQTQQRLDQQLYELQKARWVQLTDEDRDFGNPVKALALLQSTDLRIYAVVKKNVSRLTRLRNWLREAHRHGGLDTCPVLVIDDESDQASPNAASKAELDRTRVNQRIMELLELPRVAYIGYTATPFANVLINPSEALGLYPRDFIFALKKPGSYFGSEELFGARQSEEDEDSSSAPHDMIRLVADDEANQYVVQRGQPFDPVVTQALAESIRWFILATAARRLRSGDSQHSSMLVHTTMLVDPQLRLVPVIEGYVRELQRSWPACDTKGWREQWMEEQNREPPSRSGHPVIEFDDLESVVVEVLREVKVVADNSRSTERLIYGDDPATVIAVGGNTLSRGLTLEGLVSSFFLRSTSTYDSLLQMGRWFGYRPGYEDLPRIWTTRDLAEDFRFLSEIESDLRSEIARYRLENAKPIELPVKIRTHPRMQVTARNKMNFAVPGEASYSASRPQTTYFNHRDQAAIINNRAAARRLVADALAAGAREDRQDSRIVLHDVPADRVHDFVGRFSFHEDTELRSDLIQNYIATQRKVGALESWSLAVITRRESDTVSHIDLGLDDPVPLLTRSKLSKSSRHGTANIGTLMSKPDRVADLMGSAAAAAMAPEALLQARNESKRGLLLLYPIDKDSTPKERARKWREKLDAVEHLIGVAFSFPSADPRSEPTNTIQVDPALLFTGFTLDDVVYEDTEGDRNDVDLDG